MIGYAVLGLSVLAGYCVTIACALMSTMSLASAVPRFVIANHRVRSSYKLTHETMWFCCVVLGGFVTAKVGSGMPQWWEEVALAGILLLMLWRNTWEARQRGTVHQLLISLLTVGGVMAGFSVYNKFAF